MDQFAVYIVYKFAGHSKTRGKCVQIKPDLSAQITGIACQASS